MFFISFISFSVSFSSTIPFFIYINSFAIVLITTLHENLFLFVTTLNPFVIFWIVNTSSSNLKLTPLSDATSAYAIAKSYGATIATFCEYNPFFIVYLY